MDGDHPDKIMAFDALFTTNHIRMMKLLLGYLEPPLQGKLAVYIKFLELQYTLTFFHRTPRASLCPGADMQGRGADYTAILDEILPFCSSSERETLETIRNTLQNFQNMQEMMETIQMLREVSPEMFSGEGADMSQMMQMMQGMFDS